MLKRLPPPAASSCAPHCAGHSRDLGFIERSAYRLIPGFRAARAQCNLTDHLVTSCWVSRLPLRSCPDMASQSSSHCRPHVPVLPVSCITCPCITCPDIVHLSGPVRHIGSSTNLGHRASPLLSATTATNKQKNKQTNTHTSKHTTNLYRTVKKCCNQ